jgi:hypothetical protein
MLYRALTPKDSSNFLIFIKMAGFKVWALDN